MKPRSIDENPFADLKLNLLQRKIVPSYNETLRACFTVVKSSTNVELSYYTKKRMQV